MVGKNYDMSKALNKCLLDKYKTTWAENPIKAGGDFLTPVSNDDNSPVWMIEHCDGIHGTEERGRVNIAIKNTICL